MRQLLKIGDVQFFSSNADTRKHARQEEDEQTMDMREPKKTASPLSNAERLPTPDLERIFNLPFYTDELSRLPIHGNFNFSQDSWHHNPLQNSLPIPTEYAFPGTSDVSISGVHKVAPACRTDMSLDYPNNDQSVYLDIWDARTMGLWSKAPHGYEYVAVALGECRT